MPQFTVKKGAKRRVSRAGQTKKRLVLRMRAPALVSARDGSRRAHEPIWPALPSMHYMFCRSAFRKSFVVAIRGTK